MTQEIFDPEEDKFEEEWTVVLSTGGKYTLSKLQAIVVKQAIVGELKRVMFQTFFIPIPYMAEFYRVRRYLKDQVQLSARATERPYDPIPSEKWAKIKNQIYGKLGRSMSFPEAGVTELKQD